jgi:hypothetical protein
MLFGHNTNVTVGDVVYHVQTEDRGDGPALIDTTVYCRGRVMHRRTNSYIDLLPLDPDRELALKLRLSEQHRVVIEEMRSGALHLPPLPPESPPRQASAPAAPEASAQPQLAPLKLELRNAKNWLNGKRAVLEVLVQDAAGKALSAARVAARIEGAARPEEFAAESGPDGHAHLEFDMPRLAGGDIALVIEARRGATRGHLRFSLRGKPKVPVVGSL